MQYLNHRLIRWSIFLQQYENDVKYCARRNNTVADFFIRNPRGHLEKIEPARILINNMTMERIYE